MWTFKTSVRIDVPPERVFELAVDVSNYGKLYPTLKRVEILTPGPIGPGTKWREHHASDRRSMIVEIACTGVETGRRVSTCFVVGGTRYESTSEFFAEDNGTRVEATTKATPLGVLPWIVGLLTKSVWARSQEIAVRQFKSGCEAVCGSLSTG